MISQTHNHIAPDGAETPLSACNCNQCNNDFYVVTQPENEPRYCPFCGIKFLRYEPTEGDAKWFSGDE